jgi:hypothetical protein
MQVELLYFDGCPAWQEALKNLQTALQEERLQSDIQLVKINDNQEAAAFKFLGSPSFRVNGIELWPETLQRYNMNCRVYPTPNGLAGAPTVVMFREKLRGLQT